MKKTKVKGFTLTELLVVIAIFGIIMAGALQLIAPVTKMMVQADVHEGGNAAVSSIASLLRTQLSPVEYLQVNNAAMNEASREAAVEKFVDDYYNGIIKNGSTVTAPSYGKGKVHVLQIDNSQNGKISTWIYDVTFDPTASAITGSPVYTEFAVNKAYYDSYSFEVKLGTYDTIAKFDEKVELISEAQKVMMNLNSRETAFTIKASTRRNNTDYSFLTTSTMSLVNLYNRIGGPGTAVTGVYYVVDKQSAGGTLVDAIVDRADPLLTNYTKISSGIQVDLSALDANGKVNDTGYTFIYSYGAEIDTQ